MPASHTPFRPRRPDCSSNSNAQSSQSRVLKEMAHTNERESSSYTSKSRSSFPPFPATIQKISSSRILNKDGSIPKSTDELLLRGFEILREDREKRRAKKGFQPRVTSDGSSKSSDTYVCSPTDSFGPANTSEPQNSRRTDPTSSSDMQASTPRDTQDTKTRLKESLDYHEAKIRAMQAEIAAIKRAATLTRELRHEAALEQSARHGKEQYHIQKEKKGRKRRSVATTEAYMSGGNGTGSEEDVRPTKPRPISDMHVYDKSKEDNPMTSQLQVRPKQQNTETGRSKRNQENIKSSRHKLCLCPNCISVTQQVVNTLAERYAKEASPSSAPSNISLANQTCLQNPFKKSHQIDPKTYHHRFHTSRTTSSKALVSHHYPSHQTQRPLSTNISSNQNRENQRPDPLSQEEYWQRVKETIYAPCDCYECRLLANQQEFEKRNAPFPPIRNGVWARGRDARGVWYW